MRGPRNSPNPQPDMNHNAREDHEAFVGFVLFVVQPCR
jgi:hypothetical protein